MTLEAWSQGILIGLVAAYLNDQETRTDFITTVSVISDYAGQGIAKELLQHRIVRARDLGFVEIHPEVHPGNMRAISLYTSEGFVVSERRAEALMMTPQLDGVKER
jgi:ribosomal protein S18 acetylase RimI-like enzyme